MRKKVYLILLLVSLLALGIGAASPTTKVAAQSQDPTSACDHASTFLVGRSAEFPRISQLIHDTCDFRVRMNQVDNRVTRFDRRFIEVTIAANMIEMQTLEYALARTTNEEFRGVIQMMIAMHTSDMEMALNIAEEIRAETDPDLTDARVYPQTPLYDLGVRRINLVARFLDPLMSVPGGGTVTPIPTGSPTVVATGTGTVSPSRTPTAVGTGTSVSTATGTAVVTATGTNTAVVTGTAVATGTGTMAATGTGTAITGTVTAVGTGTGTTVAAGTGTVNPTGTAIPTGSPTSVPTGTSTAIPTIVGPPRADFDVLALHVLEDEHVMHIETALVAQRLARNSEIRAFAKHAADVAKLHMLLLDDLKYRLAHNITLPEPQFQEDYQSPRRLEPAGDDD